MIYVDHSHSLAILRTRIHWLTLSLSVSLIHTHTCVCTRARARAHTHTHTSCFTLSFITVCFSRPCTQTAWNAWHVATTSSVLASLPNSKTKTPSSQCSTTQWLQQKIESSQAGPDRRLRQVSTTLQCPIFQFRRRGCQHLQRRSSNSSVGRASSLWSRAMVVWQPTGWLSHFWFTEESCFSPLLLHISLSSRLVHRSYFCSEHTAVCSSCFVFFVFFLSQIFRSCWTAIRKKFHRKTNQ